MISFLCLSEMWINPEQSHPEFPSAVQKRRRFLPSCWSELTDISKTEASQDAVWSPVDVFPEHFPPQSRCNIKQEWNTLVRFTIWDVNVQLLCHHAAFTRVPTPNEHKHFDSAAYCKNPEVPEREVSQRLKLIGCFFSCFLGRFPAETLWAPSLILLLLQISPREMKRLRRIWVSRRSGAGAQLLFCCSTFNSAWRRHSQDEMWRFVPLWTVKKVIFFLLHSEADIIKERKKSNRSIFLFS